MYFLCEKTDLTSFRIIDRHFASMFRRLQFTFPEGAIFIFCADQKLSALHGKMDDLQHYWQEPFDDHSFVIQSRFDACVGTTTGGPHIAA